MNGRLVALAALVLLGAGLVLAVVQWGGRPPAPQPQATAADTSMADDADITAALAAAPVDSAALRGAWHDEVRGLDYTDLDSTRHELFLRFANAERCGCGCGFTLAGCLASDMTCEESRPRAQALLDSVRAGKIRSARGLRERPR